MGDLNVGEASDREARINLAIYDYHAAADRGEAPDRAEWLAGHPELSPELDGYFDDLAGLGLLRRPPPCGPPGETASRERPHLERTKSRSEPADLRPGDALGDYLLLERLGEGGQGVVWKARPRNSREIVVAIKTVRGPATGDPAAVYRLRADARAIARMRHENIIRTYFFGEDRGRWFFVMELMEGGTLAERLGRYRDDLRSAAALLEKVARAVHHAHTRNPGVIHLDLKTGNILVTAGGEPRVTDFGLSMRLETDGPPGQDSAPEGPDSEPDADETTATFVRAGIVGTLPYMSPEMAAGRWTDVSTASDVYGLGAVLYELLTGRPPFRGRDAKETRALVIGGDLEGPRGINPKVDRELDAVCRKCLERDPGRRYGSADAAANDLRRWLEVRPTLAGGKPSVMREARFWVRRHPRGVALAVVAALVLWAAGLAVSFAGLRAENAREAGRLASQVDRELRLVRRATQLLAGDPRLRAAFGSSPSVEGGHLRRDIESFLTTAVEREKPFGVAGNPFINVFARYERELRLIGRATLLLAARRRDAIERFLETAIVRENLFKLPGNNPFINVFVLGPKGDLIADSLGDDRFIGKNFAARDYYQYFFDPGASRERDEVYVARSYQSTKDGRYKVAVSTRIRGEGDEILGLMVANLTIGPRLIDVDIRDEPGDAAVLCPMDRSRPLRGVEDRHPPWPYIAVLDRRYTGEATDEPVAFEASRVPGFGPGPGLDQASRGPWGGRIVDYRRVGRTHIIVVLSRPCPWPLSWLPESR